jgi:hypothetical protein
MIGLVILIAVTAAVVYLVFRSRAGSPRYANDVAVGPVRKVSGVVIAVLGLSAAAWALYLIGATPDWAVSPDGSCPPTTAVHEGIACASADPRPLEFLLAPMLTFGAIAGLIGLSLARPSLTTDKKALEWSAV